jgi:MFS superfamily sulfate permease-like transporter
MHSGPRTKYDKELSAQGLGNILCGLAGGLPMTGVIVRSSANVLAGAKTRASAILHGVWMVALVALFPGVLRLVPTASLAAILVYTGYKLVSPRHMRQLAGYGVAPLVIYFVTMITIVVTDMLTGILTGLVLSLAKLVYALTHMGVRVVQDESRNRVDVYLNGAATFVRLPKFVDALDSVPPAVEAHIHFKDLDYIDHACVDVLRGWERQRTTGGQSITLEWGELMQMYRVRNSFRPESGRMPASDSVAAA